MTTDIEAIRDDLAHVRQDIEFTKHALSEEYELSEETKKNLKKASNAPESDYAELR